MHLYVYALVYLYVCVCQRVRVPFVCVRGEEGALEGGGGGLTEEENKMHDIS